MSENLTIALTLLAAGMSVVFIVLLMVVLIGRSVIYFVNKILVGEKGVRTMDVGLVHNKKIAVIAAVVNNVSKGKGRVVRIEKVEDKL